MKQDMGSLVPADWTSELRDGHLIIQHPGPVGGYVTVDFRHRGFRGGISTSGKLASNKNYAGRGWRDQLVRDAVAWLSSIYDSRKKGAR